MKARLANALVSVVIATLAMPAIGQELTSTPLLDFAKEATPITRANAVTNVLATATLLANLKDEHKPVPLYGYEISGLDEKMLSSALFLAAVGKVHVAVVEPSSNAENLYKGKAIKVSLKAEPKQLSEVVKAAFKETAKSEAYIAFTRPLRDKTAVAKFITTPQLWSNPAPSTSASMTGVAMEGTRITRASTATNVLANLKTEDKPVPLYGYEVSKLDEKMLSSALSLAAVGKVHVAVVERSSNMDNLYKSKAIRVTLKAEPKQILNAVKAAFPATENGKLFIAFTRPLRDKTAVAKFITTPHLWSEFKAGP